MVARRIWGPVALGAVGYGYMLWKTFSFSDFMYVTKQNMSIAVSNLTKHLEQVSGALAAVKKHLTQRIDNLDGKIDNQVEISKLIKSEVADVRGDISQIGYKLDSLNKIVSGLNGKITTLEEKQDLTSLAVSYLCNKADENNLSGKAQEELRLAGTSGSGGLLNIEDIVETIDPSDKPMINCQKMGDDHKARTLTRRYTVKFSSLNQLQRIR